MTVSRILWNYLWIAPHALQIAILWIMVRRKLHKTFPIFFIYTAYAVLEFLILFPMYHLVRFVPGWLYGHTRLSLIAGGALLGFGVTYEIFIYVSRTYKELSVRGITILRSVILILFALAIVLAQYTSRSQTDNPVMFIANLLERSVILLQCGLMVGLLLFAQLCHMQWKKIAFGIALGVGFYSSADLILLAVNTRIGYYYPLDYAYMGSYHVAVLIWLYYLAVPEKAMPGSISEVTEHHDLDAWSREIERLLQNR